MGNWKIIRPEATKNWIKNPSFETGTTGWTAPGTNTIAQSSAEALFGNYSGLCTYQNNNDLVDFTIDSLAFNIGEDAAAMAWIKVPSNWDGGNIRLAFTLFTGATDTYTKIWTDGVDPYDEWVRLETTTLLAADTSGDLTLQATSAPTAGRTVYLDGVQVEDNQTYATTYCDGDQDNCIWESIPHGGFSTRPSSSTAGGKIVDVSDDLGMFVNATSGAGFPTIFNAGVDRALADGRQHQRAVAKPGMLILSATIVGTSLADYHAKRKQIILDLAPYAHNEQPIIFRYEGSSSVREVKARYFGGLQMQKNTGFSEIVGLQFQVDDPYYCRVGTDSEPLDDKVATTLRQLSIRDRDGAWGHNGLNPLGTYTDFQAFAEDDQYIYVGGNFLNLDNLAAADYIARWDKTGQGQWEAMASGLTGQVRSMKLAADGTLYIVGAFTNAGGDGNADGICKWNGTAFSAVGNPTAWTLTNVQDVEIDSDGNVWICGSFLNLAGLGSADHIGYWDGSAWNAAGSGLGSATGYFVTLDKNTGDVYATGSFTAAGGVSNTNKIARWDGSAWNSVGGGVDTGTDLREALVDDNGILYVTGNFSVIGGVNAANIAKFSGAGWSQLGDGLSIGATRSISTWRDYIVIGGVGTSAPKMNLWLWSGSTLVRPDLMLGGVPSTILGIHESRTGDLWLGWSGATGSDYAGSVDIENNGSARAYPIISITRTDSSSLIPRVRSIGNETIEKYLWFDYPVLQGETITIDLRPGRRQVTSSAFGKRWKILPGSDVADFILIPGTNKINLFIEDSGGSPTFDTFIKWEETYFGID